MLLHSLFDIDLIFVFNVNHAAIAVTNINNTSRYGGSTTGIEHVSNGVCLYRCDSL
jgi:hypothetical protein